jgi:lipid II:glycine glycyltransferase (peptidoglycan interpeptide bridge formation enzyme)
MPELSAQAWDAFLSQIPDAHLLQTAAWGQLKSGFGWQAVWVITGEGQPPVGAQVLFRRLPLGLTLAYVPKGPVCGVEVGLGRENSGVLKDHDVGAGLGQEDAGVLKDHRPAPTLWAEIDAACRKRRAIFLKVEPDLWEDAAAGQPPPGFDLSAHAIQPPRTIVVDLGGSEEQILGRMKQKTRYNIRLAMKKGVVVRPCPDLELFYRLMAATGQRDRFGVHSPEYYRRAYELFQPGGACEILLAEYEGLPLAAVMVFARGSRAWYFYGASADTHREYMATYLVQWEAMRWARKMGCAEYDLWGVPDCGEEILEASFAQRSDGLWGVYRFKRGFGGNLRRSPGPWDRVYQPGLYGLYRMWMDRKASG